MPGWVALEVMTDGMQVGSQHYRRILAIEKESRVDSSRL